MKKILLLFPLLIIIVSFLGANDFSILQKQQQQFIMPDTVYESKDVDTMAYFPGSDPGLLKYLNDSCRKVPGSYGGTLYVRFVINSSGIVEDAQISARMGSFSPEQEAEAIRLIMSLKGLKPARKNGQPVAVRMILPVRIIP
jgi:hypothetical protein